MKNKKRAEVEAIAWDNGFIAGIGVGMLESIGILKNQKNNNSEVLSIDDLEKLILKQIDYTKEKYRD